MGFANTGARAEIRPRDWGWRVTLRHQHPGLQCCFILAQATSARQRVSASARQQARGRSKAILGADGQAPSPRFSWGAGQRRRVRPGGSGLCLPHLNNVSRLPESSHPPGKLRNPPITGALGHVKDATSDLCALSLEPALVWPCRSERRRPAGTTGIWDMGTIIASGSRLLIRKVSCSQHCEACLRHTGSLRDVAVSLGKAELGPSTPAGLSVPCSPGSRMCSKHSLGCVSRGRSSWSSGTECFWHPALHPSLQARCLPAPGELCRPACRSLSRTDSQNPVTNGRVPSQRVAVTSAVWRDDFSGGASYGGSCAALFSSVLY